MGSYTVKKSIDFTVKYLASGCQFFFFTRVYQQNIFRNQDMVGLMLTDSTRKYLYRIIGLYEKKKNKIMSFATVLCLIPENVIGRL